jgi:hypothetical protein
MPVKAYLKPVLIGLAALGFACAAGCDDRETSVRSYSAPKDAAPATTASSSQPTAVTAQSSAGLPFTWTLPSGWKLDPSSRPMRVATVNVEATSKTGELIVSRFRTGAFGSGVANINRWRQQVGLGPISNESEVTPEKTTVGGVEAKVYDFTGPAGPDGNPPKRTRVAMVDTPSGDAWFFRLNGPSDLVEGQRGAFDSVLQSVKFNAKE